MWIQSERFPGYEVDHVGRVRNRATKRILKPSVTRAGYRVLSLRTKTVPVHRLVAEAFLAEWDPALTVDHVNRVRDDNRLQNLRMATVAQQLKNRRTDTINHGHRLPVEQRTLDGKLVNSFVSLDAAASSTGLSTYVIAYNIKTGKPCRKGFLWQIPHTPDLPGEIWRHFSGSAWISNKGRYKKNMARNGASPRFGPAKAPHQLYNNNGYPVVRDTNLHIAVARLFIGHPPAAGMVVNHLDGDCLNADVSNLEWVTQKDNVRHAVETGLFSVLRPVEQLDDDGNVLNRFSSINAAQRAVCPNIHRAIKNGIRAGGFRWKYAL